MELVHQAETVNARHADIEEEELGRGVADNIENFRGRRSFADHLHSGAFSKHLAQLLPRERFIISQDRLKQHRSFLLCLEAHCRLRNTALRHQVCPVGMPVHGQTATSGILLKNMRASRKGEPDAKVAGAQNRTHASEFEHQSMGAIPRGGVSVGLSGDGSPDFCSVFIQASSPGIVTNCTLAGTRTGTNLLPGSD